MASKSLLTFILLACLQLSAAVSDRCTSSQDALVSIKEWKDLQEDCQTKLQNQIQMELEASITYLTMSAFYSNAKTHRPAVAKFFLESAKEERGHAKQLIEYLLMRGGDLTNTTINTITQRTSQWPNLETALNAALELEYAVTQSIKGIIKVCGAEEIEGKERKVENTAATKKEMRRKQENDYHAVDYLTGEFLKEQHEGIRHIAGHLATLKKMTSLYGNFAELMFDKSLSA